MKKRSQSFKQGLRFSVAGLVAMAAYFAAYWMLTRFVGVWYMASTVPAFLIQVGVNFALQKYWAFKNLDRRYITKQASSFFVMHSTFFALNIVILYLLVERVGMNYMLAQAVSSLFLSVLSLLSVPGERANVNHEKGEHECTSTQKRCLTTTRNT